MNNDNYSKDQDLEKEGPSSESPILASPNESEVQASSNRGPEQIVSLANEDKTDYAGFWMRFWAYLADLVIIGSVNRIVIYPVLRFTDIPLHGGFFSTVNICTAITFYIYFVLMTKYYKQTLGKMIFGLKVIPLKKEQLTWDTILFREWIGRFISASFIPLYVLVAFLPNKQGLHDLFADTAVVHERK